MEILEVKTIETLLVTEGQKELLESSTSEVILEKTPEILVETLSVTNILEVGLQGPPGPPGSGGSGGGFEPVVISDYASSYSYVGLATRIVRINYSVSPPIKQTHFTANLMADWPNRTVLEYV